MLIAGEVLVVMVIVVAVCSCTIGRISQKETEYSAHHVKVFKVRMKYLYQCIC